MKLRIVTWNCNMALYQKFDRLLALRPDVAVIQECASPERDAARGWQPHCSSRDWIGFNADKGLGVFTFGSLRVRRHQSYTDTFSLYLPVQIDGPCRFNLLGVWMADYRRIPTGSTNDPASAVKHYRRFLTNAPSVVAGDFNLLPQQMAFRTGEPHDHSLIELLAQAGLRNVADLPIKGSSQRALKRTHFHQRKPGRGFVVDYLFVPGRESVRLAAFEVGDPRDWIQWSDHVPLVAEFDLARESAFTHRAVRAIWPALVMRTNAFRGRS
jgi:exodeoxyribonuclease III